jgi:hypothetical protein
MLPPGGGGGGGGGPEGLLSADVLIHLIHKSKVPPMAGIGGGGGGGGGAGMMGSCDQCTGRFAQCALSLRQI